MYLTDESRQRSCVNLTLVIIVIIVNVVIMVIVVITFIIDR